MSSSFDTVYGLGSTRIVVPVGATNALLFTPIVGQNGTLFKYWSGGTLEVIGVPAGVTLTAQNLADANGNHYLLGTSEVLSLDGPARFYLSSTGSTTVLMALIGKSAGT